METLFLFFALLLICGLVGSLLGGMVSRRSLGFWLAILLGPIGWLIVLLLPRPDRFATAATSAPTPALSAAARVDALAKLADLREKGIVTPAQFEAQKAELLTDAKTVPIASNDPAYAALRGRSASNFASEAAITVVLFVVIFGGGLWWFVFR